MDKALSYGQMEPSSKDKSTTTKYQDEVAYYTEKEMSMRENSTTGNVEDLDK